MDEVDTDLTITSKVEYMSPLEQERQEREFESRLRSVCAGLLEVHHKNRYKPGHSIRFMHRTVLDFVEPPDVKSLLEGFTTGTSFQPVIAIIGACILQLKWLVREKAVLKYEKYFWGEYFWGIVKKVLQIA